MDITQKTPPQKTPWHKSGEPWIWLNAGAIALSIVMVIGLLGLIAVRGLGHFWPADIQQFDYQGENGETAVIIGEIVSEERVPHQQLAASNKALRALLAADDVRPEALVTRYLVKSGNRDVYGLDFQWLVAPLIQGQSQPRDLLVIERFEWGNFYGYLESVSENGVVKARGQMAWDALQKRIERVATLNDQIEQIKRGDIGKINYQVERLRLQEKKLALKNALDASKTSELHTARDALGVEYAQLQTALNRLIEQSQRDSIQMRVMDGQVVDISLAQIVRAYRPNQMHTLEKLGLYATRLGAFLSDEPREANTEGGIFPAIFGTVMMVLVMSVLVTPFGVIAAVYLREYARQGVLIRLVRIAVNNLAGVPSIVYGVFGLGFFVYFLGGSIDTLFYPELKPAPTFGTPGLLWASLTLALLTVPVVIVATEEGLARVPRSIREGSLALGATKIETLWHTVLPMASPAIMTGVILAIARAAGEVAPLMLVGVVKLAPSLPLDGNFPFLHLERKFMHLGFHIYDVGFQSPNVEAARPLVYATSLVLIVVIILLNVLAISIRNRLREKYKALEN